MTLQEAAGLTRIHELYCIRCPKLDADPEQAAEALFIIAMEKPNLWVSSFYVSEGDNTADLDQRTIRCSALLKTMMELCGFDSEIQDNCRFRIILNKPK